MASTAQSSSIAGSSIKSESTFPSLQLWLTSYGTAEYSLYKKETPAPHLSYDDWIASEHILGPYLYHLALDAWDEESSDDKEDEKSVQPVSVKAAGRKSKTNVTTNGIDALQIADTPKTSAATKANPTSTTPKRRGGRRKKARSTSPAPINDAVVFTPVVESATPSVGAPSSDDPASSAPRRGMRTRTAAQQRPFFHTAQVFNEEGLKDQQTDDDKSPVSNSKLAQVTVPVKTPDIFDNEYAKEIHGDDASKPRVAGQPKRKPRKKTQQQDGTDLPADKENQLKAESAPKKKRGRPKKSLQSENIKEHETQSRPDDELRSRQTSIADSTAVQPKSISKEKPRKPKKSSSTITAAKEVDEIAENDFAVNHTPTQKKKVLSRAPRKKQRKSAALITASDDESTDGDGTALMDAEVDELQPGKTPPAVREDGFLEKDDVARDTGKKRPPEPIPDDSRDSESEEEETVLERQESELDETDNEDSLQSASDETPAKISSKTTGDLTGRRKLGRAISVDSDTDYKPYLYNSQKKKMKRKSTPKKRASAGILKSADIVHDDDENDENGNAEDSSIQAEQHNSTDGGVDGSQDNAETVDKTENIVMEETVASPIIKTRTSSRKGGSNASDLSKSEV